jgi:hypothetical protein
MGREKKLQVKLLIVIGQGHCGPIGLTIYAHHKPDDLIRPGILDVHDVFELPDCMKSAKPLCIYSMRKQCVLNPTQTYAKQHIHTDDIFLLTDLDDGELIKKLCEMLAREKGLSAIMETKHKKTRERCYSRST